ncbi:MAG: hypothetical protein J7M40_03400, partial [Planctomycetes bacterium]|nr:hypothetical protein [Planctomycetota bacterium]
MSNRGWLLSFVLVFCSVVLCLFASGTRAGENSGGQDVFDRAVENGRLANEGFWRCRLFVDGWLAHADPKTGLIPRNLSGSKDIWNAKDSAADNYPFMVLATAITDRELFEGRMLDMLRTETKLTSRIGAMPDTYSFAKGGFAADKANLDSIMFGSSEYIKDGLLPLTEWLGASPWSERMIAILDDMWAHAPVDTPYGKIVSQNVEVNGEMLQTLSRVFWMTGDKKYLDWAIRLGDYYLLGDHHPTRSGRLRLRDHGCEIVSGLCELYAAVHFAMPEKKKAYRKPVHEMLDRILEVGRNEHGLFYNWVEPVTGKHDKNPCDTWGYTLNGFYSVYLLDGDKAYREATIKALNCLYDNYRNYAWEGASSDGHADSIESALNLYNREPEPAAAKWIDHDMRVMWNIQKDDGVIEGWHGDGNFARTTIMYCLWKTKGVTVRPWRKDVVFGAEMTDDGLRLAITADKAWQGRIIFDSPRHKTIMNMPLDWPRINQFPEWFTVEAGNKYTVRDSAGKSEKIHSARQMQEGIEVHLFAGQQKQLTVKKSMSRHDAAEIQPPPVRTITKSPKFHWFGYYDKLQFDPTGRYVLGMEVDFEGRSPRPDDVIKIGMVDLKDNDKWIELGTSSAWGWQQGCMLQWRPGSRSEILYNDRQGDHYVCRMLDVFTRKLRTVNYPIYSVSPNGKVAVSADFRRIQDMRPGYGYAGLADPHKDESAPKDSGVFLIDLNTGKSKLIISLAQISKVPYEQNPQDALSGKHYFNHLLFAPDGKRFIFLNRWRVKTASGYSGFRTRMFTAAVDGGDIRLIDGYGKTSHFIWRDPGNILAWAWHPSDGNKFYLYEDGTGKVEVVGKGVMTHNGHCTYLPGNEWILNDTYPSGANREQNVYLYN